MKLIIAEKKSVGETIAKVLGVKAIRNGYLEGDDYIISWCQGHLVGLALPDSYGEQYKQYWTFDNLPIIPQKWIFEADNGKIRQLKILKELIFNSSVDEIICATDAGREGECIFRYVYNFFGCRKPVKRLWISSMEDSAIREGMNNLQPYSKFDNLFSAGLCRAKADWLVGMNGSRLFSNRYRTSLNVGRVQTPVLAMVVQRDYDIAHFVKQKYYTVEMDCGDFIAATARIDDESFARNLAEICNGKSAVVTAVTKETKTVNPPKLYDLTTLQREANKLFGYTAKQTLNYLQSLYDAKLATYPRTDSQYLTEDMGQTAQHLVSDLLGLLPFAQGLDLTPEVGRILNSKKVSDHHAIIPTSEFVKQGFTGLAESECKLMNLVCSKLLCAIAAPHEYETVTAVFSCAGNEFTAKGKTVLVPGWKEIDQRFRSTLKADTEEEMLNTLPELAEGQSFRVTSTVSEHFTSPPKAYTEDTLLSAMERAGAEDMPEDAERKGLGTPATRAAILEKLVQMGFVQRKGKQLVPTKDGINLAVVLPESLTSPVLTAEWENRLTEIAKGNADADEFMAEIEAQVRQLVKTYSCISADKQNLFQSERVIIGKCPRCSENVYEGKKNFYCGNRSCQFVMWKNDRFFEQRKKAFTPKIAAALLKNGKAKVKGLYSEKTGKTYDATVLLADTGGKYVNYRVERKE